MFATTPGLADCSQPISPATVSADDFGSSAQLVVPMSQKAHDLAVGLGPIDPGVEV